MSYSPTLWVEKVTKVGPTNLNHLETGLQAAAAVADLALAAPVSKVTNGAVYWNGSAWVDALLVNANIDPAAAIGVAKIAAAPICQAVRNSTFQSITTATLTAIAFNDADPYDALNMHDPVTNNTRITCGVAGVYALKATVVFAANATGIRGVGFRINGSSSFGWIELVNAAALPTVVSTSWDLPMVVNDFAEVVVFQNSGGALNAGSSDATTGQSGTYFNATRLGT